MRAGARYLPHSSSQQCEQTRARVHAKRKARMQPFRTLNFSGDYDREGEKFEQRYRCDLYHSSFGGCNCRIDTQPSSQSPQIADRECLDYTPRLHFELKSDVTRLKTIFTFGRVSGISQHLKGLRLF